MENKTPNEKEWKERFRKQYDFSESKTLEYDNLMTIEQFIESLLSQKDKDWEQQIDGIVGLRQFDLHGEQVIKVKDLYLIALLKQNK